MSSPAPSLSHLAKFVSKRGRRRAGIVNAHRRQVEAPPEERFPSSFYSPLIAAARRYIDNGYEVDEIGRTIESAPQRKRSSFAVVGAGLRTGIHRIAAGGSVIPLRSEFRGGDGNVLVSVRPQLQLQLRTGREIVTFIHCAADQLTDEAVAVLLFLIGHCYPDMAPAVLNARGGRWSFEADYVPEYIESLLLSELEEYRQMWDAA